MADFRQNVYYGDQYSNTDSYIAGQRIVFNNRIYEAVVDTTANPPIFNNALNDTYWSLIGDAPARGYYQYITFDNLLNNFMFEKTGEDTLLGKVNRNKVAYSIQRSIQMLSYDVLKITRTLNTSLNPNTRSIVIPQDFVNLVGVHYVDNAGNKRQILPQTNVSTGQDYMQDDDYSYTYTDDGELIELAPTQSVTNFQNPSSPTDYYATSSYSYGSGFNDFEQPYAGGYFKRYGLNPEFAQGNGWYVMDEERGIIYFSSDFRQVRGTENVEIVVDYISDGLADDANIRVNKLAEEAVYKMAEYKILSNKSKESAPDYVLRRVKKEADTEMRNAKIRFMNLNFGELSQVFREQNVWIKH